MSVSVYVHAMPMYARRGRGVAGTCALLRWVLERELRPLKVDMLLSAELSHLSCLSSDVLNLDLFIPLFLLPPSLEQ